MLLALLRDGRFFDVAVDTLEQIVSRRVSVKSSDAVLQLHAQLLELKPLYMQAVQGTFECFMHMFSCLCFISQRMCFAYSFRSRPLFLLSASNLQVARGITRLVAGFMAGHVLAINELDLRAITEFMLLCTSHADHDISATMTVSFVDAFV